jgi:hypothetical protein
LTWVLTVERALGELAARLNVLDGNPVGKPSCPLKGEAELSGGRFLALPMIPMLSRGPTMLLSGVLADDETRYQRTRTARALSGAIGCRRDPLRVASLFG